jgi:hypothetical protein
VNPLTTPHMAAGALGGIRVVERPDLLRYDEMYIAEDGPYIVVGEAAHFTWRVEQLQANRDCRRAVAVELEKAAHRILGKEASVGPLR